MRKTYVVLLIVGLVIVLLAIVGGLGFLILFNNCGGIAGWGCPKGYTCEISDPEIMDARGKCVKEEARSESFSDYVEYNESFGKVCPLDKKFLGKKDTNPIGCECPKKYKMESEIIGYDQCYGPGTECPIMGSWCVKEK